tara:strand:- start:1441 stop:1929 length:489 start_codon:yes stop_codon:yes gene_type:complete
MYLKKIKLIKKLCKNKELNISLAESCTGGLLSALLTQIPGSSEFFDGSYIVYSNKSKINLLGVSSTIIKKYGAVSKNTSLDMAKSLYKKTKTSIVISITGVAGPDGGTKNNPVGTVFFTIGFENKKNVSYKTFHKKFKNTDRKSIQQKSALFAIDQTLKIIN